MPADQHDACFIERVVLRNYKSIAACDVRLGPLTFLVGANGSGKSNFLDALRLIPDALRNGFPHALRERGGVIGVLPRPIRSSTRFGMRLDFFLPSGLRGHFAFEVGGPPALPVISREECFISGAGGDEHYRVRAGEVLGSTLPLAPSGVSDRLYLVNASGSPAFKPVFDALSSMAFYNLIPDRMRDLVRPDGEDYLARDGENLSSILSRLNSESPQAKSRIEAYLAQVVPGFTGVAAVTVGARDLLAFRQQLASGTSDQWFTADSVSDGTLRALGILVALLQGRPEDPRPMLVGIEEPETGLHPAATEVLLDAFREAGEFRQIIVTSHSPDLLDTTSISDSEIIAVVAEDGRSSLGPLDQTGRSVLRDHLYTAGQLLRMHQLRPGAEAFGLDSDEVDLFGVRESADR